PEAGIFAAYTQRSKILHNTIHDPENALQRLIRVAHENDGLVVAGNLLSGPPMRLESEKGVDVGGNVTADMTALFAGVEEGNLHLTAAAAPAPDARERSPDALSDFDGEPRGERPGVGADEVLASVPLARGRIQARAGRPARFPHRIWAACDFESLTRDYGWFGSPEKKEIPAYPGNATAMGLAERQSGAASAAMTGINPVPGPRMGKVNKLYLRYYIEGTDEAIFQHFSLSTEDNNHILVTGLVQSRWTELTLDFTRYGLRNDGTPGIPFKEGERMDDFKVFLGKPGDGRSYRLLLDDIVFFAEDPALPREPEPFPNRVIYLAAFDTGEKERYWPGDFEIVEKEAPAGAYWRVARSVLSPKGRGKFVRLQIDPIRAVGEHTKLRFRYYLKGASRMTVQVFDLTDNDNRHVHLEGLKEEAWTTAYVDFTRDGKRNDGSATPFAAGHQVDDLFFFVDPGAAGGEVDLFLDEVTLFDAARG
ncbi:MAG TPA: hypothetical protein VMT52_15205, partial [Planctomycetota bacterium]|nr:hypothetical protein [Planctomycetota bacterium]